MTRHGRTANPIVICAAALAGAAVISCGGAAFAWPAWATAAGVAAVAAAGVLAALAGRSPDVGGDARAGRPAAAIARSGDAETARAELTVLLDAVDEPVIATGPDGVVTLCNVPAATVVGIPTERIVGRPLEEVFTSEEVLALHARAAAGATARGSVRLARPEGRRVYETSAVPLGTPGGRGGVVMTLRDVTELSRAVQVKADFVANASHELRTPIAALKAAAETLSGEARDDPPMRDRLIGMMSENIGRLEEMVRDLLDLSRLESPDMKVEESSVPASRLRGMLAPDFEKVCRERGLRLEFDFDPALEGLRTDPRLLAMILKNLVENATKFANEGTAVRVVGRPLEADPGGRAAASRGVRFEVIDQGIGIPLDQQQRIFERYYQVDPSRAGTAQRRGTGLGLAIVKHAVRTLGGSVRVHSVWKQGTTMTVDLPECLRALRGEGGPRRIT